jgi:predicted  nucleic acid-binding Zn-ribbon protein
MEGHSRESWTHASWKVRTTDPPLQPIDYIAKELDRMATSIAGLKEALADVAVEAEAAVTMIKERDEKIASLEAAGTGEGPTQEEVDDLTTSATTAATELKGAVEAATPLPINTETKADATPSVS